MKLVDRGEILGLAEYESIRERFRARVIAEKKLRRVQLGPEGHGRLREPRHDAHAGPGDASHRAHHAAGRGPARDRHLQRARPGTRRAVVHGDDRDRGQGRARRLPAGGARASRSTCGSSRAASASRRARSIAVHRQDRTTAVHYLKFALPAAVAVSMRIGRADGDRPGGRPPGIPGEGSLAEGDAGFTRGGSAGVAFRAEFRAETGDGRPHPRCARPRPGANAA